MENAAFAGVTAPDSAVEATLQVSLAPVDARHAEHVLPHQLRQWAGQVTQVLLTVDLHRSRGRFGAAAARRKARRAPLARVRR